MAKSRNRTPRRNEVSSASALPSRSVMTSRAIQLYGPAVPPLAPFFSTPRPSRPASYSSAPVVHRAPARTTIAKAIKLYKGVIGGVVPNAHLVCLGRSARREVLHALGKAGKRGQKRPRFTAKSKVKCP